MNILSMSECLTSNCSKGLIANALIELNTAALMDLTNLS